MSGTFAHAHLLVRLGTEPDLRYTSEGRPYCRLSVAADRYLGKDAREKATDWFTVVLFDRLAEVGAEYLRKGTRVFVDGRLTTRSWEEKGGRRRRTTEIVASQLIILDSPHAPAPEPPAAAATPTEEPTEDETPF